MNDAESIEYDIAHLIESRIVEIDEAVTILSELLEHNRFSTDLAPISDVLASVRRELHQRLSQTYDLALVRVNLRDERYKLLRVIDGDTLVVGPPQELTSWVNDIHVRLYGVDTPELNQTTGPVYKKILEHLCRKGEVQIIWERERLGTNYAGFPLSSFGRGVGNVFVILEPLKEPFAWSGSHFYQQNAVLYVNALLASLPHVTLERDGKRLLRGAKHLESVVSQISNWTDVHPRDHCFLLPFWPGHVRIHAEFNKVVGDNRSFWEPLWRRHVRYGFPWVLPKEIITESGRGTEAIKDALVTSLSACECERCAALSQFLRDTWGKLNRETKGSVFDPILYLANNVNKWHEF